jgi:hypothetical protein
MKQVISNCRRTDWSVAEVSRDFPVSTGKLWILPQLFKDRFLPDSFQSVSLSIRRYLVSRLTAPLNNQLERVILSIHQATEVLY